MEFRERARPLKSLKVITPVQHATLKSKGAKNHLFWSTKNKRYAPWVAKFKSRIKTYYLFDQRGMCCYCSRNLFPNAKTYDAEHIVDKSSHPQFMFDLDNFGASCVLCNSHKSNKNVLRRPGRPLTRLPRRSADYLLLHPHLDEWDHHLYFDNLGRIKARPGSAKGEQTIAICGINAVNFFHLSMKFSKGAREEAHELMNHVVC